MRSIPDACPAEPTMSCELANTVNLLRDEVVRLNRAVASLESHAAGRAVQLRDASLSLAGVSLSAAAVVWILQAVL